VHDGAEHVCDPSVKYGIVVVEHVDHIEGYVLSPAIVLITEGYWKCDFAYGFHLLASEPI
jgi:hypothetical protein